MTYLAKAQRLQLADFEKLVSGLKWNKGWHPSFPTLHNTYIPSLKQYLAYSPSAHDAWGDNLSNIYKSKKWHSGVHLVAAPDCIWYLCDLEQDGVSVSCWNKVTIGIEMVGNFETEAFDSGPGAKVRDNAVGIAAALCHRFGWTPDPLVQGHAGLHFHRMCARDHHPCPGKLVDRAAFVKLVQARMAAISAPSKPPVIASEGASA